MSKRKYKVGDTVWVCSAGVDIPREGTIAEFVDKEIYVVAFHDGYRERWIGPQIFRAERRCINAFLENSARYLEHCLKAEEYAKRETNKATERLAHWEMVSASRARKKEERK